MGGRETFLLPKLTFNITKGFKVIDQLKISKKTNFCSLLNFIVNERDYDFYFTENNERFYVTDEKSLKRFIKVCRFIYVLEEKGEYQGIIMLWKSTGAGTDRYYLKMRAENDKVANGLITVLLWNTQKEVFAKIRKDSKFFSVLKQKGFRFLGGRGVQVLLSKKSNKEKTYGRNNNNFRNAS